MRGFSDRPEHSQDPVAVRGAADGPPPGTPSFLRSREPSESGSKRLPRRGRGGPGKPAAARALQERARAVRPEDTREGAASAPGSADTRERAPRAKWDLIEATPPGGLDREEIHRPRPTAPRGDPGGNLSRLSRRAATRPRAALRRREPDCGNARPPRFKTRGPLHLEPERCVGFHPFEEPRGLARRPNGVRDEVGGSAKRTRPAR